jgi:hypothetical protein
MNTAELHQIDMRFEGYRLKDRVKEKQLMCSIAEYGIREPLQCVEKSGGAYILLDGFKRLRCSQRLGINKVPVVSIGSDEADAIIRFMRLSCCPGLSILEQAMLIDQLSVSHGLGVREIARQLEHSPAWVSLRLGIIGDMSRTVRAAVFSGRFPVRSYMYTLRVFTRVNRVKKTDIDAFVKAVSGKELSIRAIELLADGFFKGGAELRAQILCGNIDWTLNHLRQEETDSNPLSEPEKRTLKDLELLYGCISRLVYRLRDSRLQTEAFYRPGRKVAGKILKNLKTFGTTLEEFHGNTTKQEGCGKNTVCAGQE